MCVYDSVGDVRPRKSCVCGVFIEASHYRSFLMSEGEDDKERKGRKEQIDAVGETRLERDGEGEALLIRKNK